MESTMITTWMLVLVMLFNQGCASIPTSIINASSSSSTISPTSSQIHNNKDCSSINEVTITALPSPPYVLYDSDSGLNGKKEKVRGVLVDFFISTIKMCYHHCPPLNIKWKVVNTTEKLVEEITSGRSNIVLPITSALEINLTWPDYTGTPIIFRSIVKTGSRALIVDKNHFNEKSMVLMLQALLNSWPIFAFTFLLAGLSGIFIWVLESRVNTDEFQGTFTKGWWEGFWWAFVSMTTVGYGDKTPKTVFGRVFGVAWILVGLVIIAMFTATATNALTLINSGIDNKKVAVLVSTGAHLHAFNKGAQPIEYSSFKDMYEALKSNAVEGIFIDQYAGTYYMNKTSDDAVRVLTSFDTTIDYLIAFSGRTFKSMLANRCLEEALEHPSSGHLLQKYTLPFKTFSFNDDYKRLLSSGSKNTITIMYVLLVILGLGLITGFGIELIKKRNYKCLICYNKQNACELTSQRQESKSNESYTATLDEFSNNVKSHNAFASPYLISRDNIEKLKDAYLRLKHLDEEIKTMRTIISHVIGSHQRSEQEKMRRRSYFGP